MTEAIDPTLPIDQRSLVLNSIRQSLRKPEPAANILAEYAAIPRTYRRRGSLTETERIALFEERLVEYDAGVYHCSVDTIAATVADILARRGKTNLTIPIGMPASWLPKDLVFHELASEDAEQLNATEGIVSGCTLAIAETGSIVLQNAAAQGPRILSLVPDYHLCIVSAKQIVEQVPQAFERLKETSSLPTTFISGPSATADIEMTRIKGVHGPRFLDVVIVEGEG